MADTVLDAEEHFAGLREAVWVRFCARQRGADRDRFEDLYAEWWAREVERAARGNPSRAAVPAAFVAEAVHRVLIDDVRARARGIGREDKGALDIVDIDDQRGTAGADDTAATASYEALAHRILTLVRGSLSERELRVFVWSFLYMQSTDQTAAALGLSAPRVKKDRKRIAAKIGGEVWAVLSGELDLCAAYSEQSVPAIFEILTVHVEDCPTCSVALGGVRRGALAVLGPEALLLGASGSAESASGVLTDLLHGAFVRVQGLWHRATETLVALPPNGRTAAAVAVAVTTVAGGAATVVPDRGRDVRERSPERRIAQVERREPARTPAPTASVSEVATTPPPPAPVRTPRPKAKSSQCERRAATAVPASTAAPAPAEVVGQEVGFEQQAPSTPAAAAPPPSSSGGSASAPAPSAPSQEFGIEGP